ncbi:hypothetical protein [Candidatus Poriferisodalis sp.]|uniref:hypothetical protein n=1 Tax=Candidatus Poriferisodalis sp. TaxID=3101277 RepID=UPI003B518375
MAAVALIVSAIGSILWAEGPPFGSWGFLAGTAAGAVALIVLVVRLIVGSLLPFEIGRGIYRWVTEKRRHRAWSKQAAQRDMFMK